MCLTLPLALCASAGAGGRLERACKVHRPLQGGDQALPYGRGGAGGAGESAREGPDRAGAHARLPARVTTRTTLLMMETTGVVSGGRPDDFVSRRKSDLRLDEESDFRRL